MAHRPSVILVKDASNCSVLIHWHIPNEQVLMVSGVAHLEIKGEEAETLQPGGFAYILSRGAHRFSCLGGCMYFLTTDASFDVQYVDEAGNMISAEQAFASAKRPQLWTGALKRSGNKFSPRIDESR